MPTATRPTDDELTAIGSEFNPPLPEGTRPPRSPALKRPENLANHEWAIMKAARNEDVVKRINDFLAGDVELSPEEAAVLLEVVSSVTSSILREIRKLRQGVQPKIDANAAMADTLHTMQMRLFRVATGRAEV